MLYTVSNQYELLSLSKNDDVYRFDTILEEAAQNDDDKWVLPCDLPEWAHVCVAFVCYIMFVPV